MQLDLNCTGAPQGGFWPAADTVAEPTDRRAARASHPLRITRLSRPILGSMTNLQSVASRDRWWKRPA